MYKRIVLKLSGETLAPLPESGESGIYSRARVEAAAKMLMKIADKGIELIVILGGGNIWRGRFDNDMDAVTGDQMGMLATIMNAICAQEAITRLGGKAKVFTAQEMTRFAELYTRDRADEALKAGNIVFVAGGSGNPFFTTDTAAALRAAELRADAVFKGTTVDGIYDKDPRKGPATLIKDITYQQCIDMGIAVMDTTAFVICKDRGVKEIRVFNMDDLDNIVRAANGEDIGTVAHA